MCIYVCMYVCMYVYIYIYIYIYIRVTPGREIAAASRGELAASRPTAGRLSYMERNI